MSSRTVQKMRKADMQTIVESQDALYERLLSGVTSILEERAIQSGVPTCDSMASSIMKRLEDEGILQLFRTRNDTSNADGHNTENDTTADAGGEELSSIEDSHACSYPVYHWGGGMHLFPPGVKLPTGSVEQAWMYWCCGDTAKKLPPFRQIRPADLVNPNQQKRLCELKFLMTKLERAARVLGLATTNIILTDAAVVFKQCKSAIEMPRETQKNRKRRRGQLMWVSVGTFFRKNARCTGRYEGIDPLAPPPHFVLFGRI
ncbi:Hypothetical protein PHPALM_14129 [Phytophthora palmivora]|uniref:Uncharacterized protein n=1 Tax=Phytophthora palmivora TaxID=4796 RepID=A0A2P4XVI4_9STRA|nr:Hypothetical protein PHPALM_14129 [Phytophthora palmivora]